MKKIFLLMLPILFFILAFDATKTYKITGTIKDELGMPIAYAIIHLEGTTNGVSSDKSGSYSISVINKSSSLRITAVGHREEIVKTKGRVIVNVILKKLDSALEEVVVTGYAMNTTRRKEGLQARVSGVRITTSNSTNTPALMYDSDNANNRDGYDRIQENAFVGVSENPLSTFSIDVDAASYSNVRRHLNSGQLPPEGAVRIEEMINYFNYDYPQPLDEQPFSFTTEMSECPWNTKHRLILIGMQGKTIPTSDLPSSNLVFLVDVSGSMQDPNKLPLVKASLNLLVDQLREQDKVSIVVYAGAAGLVLPSTNGNAKSKIKDAIEGMEAGGSTAGGEGLRLAYKIASEQFIKDGNNRVILCSDGDFNVGMSSDDEMERLIEVERNKGVFLTVLGYGTGNYQDSKMQKLANKGNGNHAYIDGISEAKKVLVNEFGGTLFTIAKDVKLQIEFNPAKVQGYRLIGYENRLLYKEDFNNDKKDAGELGSGHRVTALYEIIPAGPKSAILHKVDSLRYQSPQKILSDSRFKNEIMTVKFRYKPPVGQTSNLIEKAVYDLSVPIAKSSDNFRLASAVAEFGLLLRNSEFKSAASYGNVLRTVNNVKGIDTGGYKVEFMRMVEKAKTIYEANALHSK